MRTAASAPSKRAADFQWRPPDRRHRRRVADIAMATGAFRPDEIEVALEVFDDFCAAPGVDYRALAAFADGAMAGFAFYGPTPCTVDTWDLYWIVVHPDFHRSGVGRGLIERVERDMQNRGARMCVIETSSRDDYSASRRFYDACGYKEVARVPDFYDERDDRVTYTKLFVGVPSPRVSARGEDEGRGEDVRGTALRNSNS
ncbi:MAG: GNAT family N-acetyltransferase [Gemmatimonadetes bacterium]|uniref:GNAT family N-acetyltransferase n=1 Tax=Candidatus Kutchimonas denitrificans TaxID=3056748 RepID=A0AAE4Z9E4_9BACT|nr:GNAT family N-acetyltransferase [Gemmatimonadota bacterium]NIR75463.1 GNAT family N-acetyltransferase [Candidatus Kutchimonas denitrificans]NIS01777.1 GNAT family N-acetyltransferase [Gemmatimonadota bacterium]NIT67558.1 GNAT family N-acetyltransferase [Gemmatimonadota bacterium]NIU53432.1 GNAT family N-acetyltransferase [Gemmatimonadota bacterium]